MKAFALILLLLIIGCSAPVLKVPNMLNKSDNIRVLILPFDDLTGQYKKEWELEKHLTQKLNNEFKGILLNPRCLLKTNKEPPRYKKVSSPYVFEYAENAKLLSENNFSSIYYRYGADLVITGIIEVIEYTNKPKSLLPSYLIFGILGAALTDRDNEKFCGVIGTRCLVFNAKNNLLMNESMAFGFSEKAAPVDLRREDAIKKAIKNIDDTFFYFFSLPDKD